MHIDPNSGWWVLAYPKMLANTSTFIMMEAYDNQLLWDLSPPMIRLSRELELLQILGNQANVEEFIGILIVMERANFPGISPTWRERGEKRDYRSPGRMGPEADWNLL